MKPLTYPLLIFSPTLGQESNSVTNHPTSRIAPAALVAA